jgi:hypothetical protein
MGLFGITLIVIAQRVKEIGVRKVLGASVTGIAMLVSKSFIRPVIVAIVVASPIAWWACRNGCRIFHTASISAGGCLRLQDLRIIDRHCNDQLPGNQSSTCESGEEFEDGMRWGSS